MVEMRINKLFLVVSILHYVHQFGYAIFVITHKCFRIAEWVSSSFLMCERPEVKVRYDFQSLFQCVKCWFQLIFCTLINNLVYVPSKRFSSCCDIVHDFEPYRSMLSTQVLNKFIFVLVEMPEVHVVWSLLQATHICAFLISKYFLQDDIYDYIYLKSSACINIFSFKDLNTLCHNLLLKCIQFCCSLCVNLDCWPVIETQHFLSYLMLGQYRLHNLGL